MRTLTLCVCLLFAVIPITTASEGHVATQDEHTTTSTNGSTGMQSTRSIKGGPGTEKTLSAKGEAAKPVTTTKGAGEDRQTATSPESVDGSKTATSTKTEAGSTTTTKEANQETQTTSSTVTRDDIKIMESSIAGSGESTTQEDSEDTQTTSSTEASGGTESATSKKAEARSTTTTTGEAGQKTQAPASAEVSISVEPTESTKSGASAPTLTTGGPDEKTQATPSTKAGNGTTITPEKEKTGVPTTTAKNDDEHKQTTKSIEAGGSTKTTESRKGEKGATTTIEDDFEPTQTASPTETGDGIETSASRRTEAGASATTTGEAGEDTHTTALPEARDVIKSTSRDGAENTSTTASTGVGGDVTTTATTKDEAGALDTTSAGTKQDTATTVQNRDSISEGASKDGVLSTPTSRFVPEDDLTATTVSKTDSASSTSIPKTGSTSTFEVPASTESSPIPDRTTCSESKTNECRKTPFGKCEVRNGEDQCSCESPLKLIGKSCRLENKTVVKLVFKVTRKSQTLYSNDDECPSDEDIKEEIQQNLQRKKIQILEISNIKCDGGEITMDIAILDNSDNKIVDKVKEALQDAIPTFGDFNIDREGIDATLFDQCQMGLSEIGKKLGGLKCEKKENAYLLACDETLSTLVETVDISGILVQLCQDKPCSEYCDVTQNKRCLREKCVCKHGFVPDNGTCVDACRPNICKNGGTCQPHKEVQFMCMCPSKFKGLFCEEENKELHSAKLNIVIVGVVLSALLLMCFVVSASIISRMKKKNNLLAHDSKDVERRRELHGYDGPYNANSSASKHRDHTSL